MKKAYLICFILITLGLLVGCTDNSVSDDISHENVEASINDLPLEPKDTNTANGMGENLVEPTQLRTVDDPAPESIAIPIQGEKYDIDDSAYNQVPTSPVTETISIDSILSLTLLSDELAICWYIENDVQTCAYRRYGGDWIRFLTEDSVYRHGYGAGLYTDLFKHSGFYIQAPRGVAYYAQDYYYFDEDGSLKLLFAGTHLDLLVNFNDDGDNELLWFYHGGRDAVYFYTIGADIYMFDLVEQLSLRFDDWQDIEIDPLSLQDKTMRLVFQRGDKQYEAQILFTPDELVISEVRK